MRHYYLGIDPGAKGAICLMVTDPEFGTKIEFLDNGMPPAVLHQKFSTVSRNVNMCMIEDVASIPGASAKSNFMFGWNVSMLHTLLSLQQDFGYDVVKPKVWQKAVGVSVPIKFKGAERKKRIKNQVAEICERLYPNCAIRGPKGGLLDGRSDALMIAHYCRLKYSNQNM